jgi:hypothetical protein
MATIEQGQWKSGDRESDGHAGLPTDPNFLSQLRTQNKDNK